MPWLVSSHLDHVSSSPCQRECERTCFSFYCAVREQLPVWALEDMRSMEVFCWEDGGARPCLPSEALLYALVHDHREYARHLLDRYSVDALRAPRCSFCRARGSGSPHMQLAVRYDRRWILALMLEALQREPQCARAAYLDGCGGCAHATDGGKTAVELAVEMSRADCLMMLLAQGARPPHALDAALHALRNCCVKERREARRCLLLVLLFSPQPPVLRPLLDDKMQLEQHLQPHLEEHLEEHLGEHLENQLQELLGEDGLDWLYGRSPLPLVVQALRILARSGPDQITKLPDFLQLHGWR